MSLTEGSAQNKCLSDVESCRNPGQEGLDVRIQSAARTPAVSVSVWSKLWKHSHKAGIFYFFCQVHSQLLSSYIVPSSTSSKGKRFRTEKTGIFFLFIKKHQGILHQQKLLRCLFILSPNWSINDGVGTFKMKRLIGLPDKNITHFSTRVLTLGSCLIHWLSYE